MSALPVFTSLAPENVDKAHEFLSRMVKQNPGLYIRPKTALAKAAARPNRGILAEMNGDLVGFTAFYDTEQPDWVESGSTSISPVWQGVGIGTLLLSAALVSLYERPENREFKVIGSVFENNYASKKMVDAIGFLTIKAPLWYDEAHKKKAQAQQKGHAYHCVVIDYPAVAKLSLIGNMPQLATLRVA